MSKPRHVHLVVNPASGQHAANLEVLNDAFRANAVQWDASITRYAGHARLLARRAVDDGADVVAAYGGDGTVADVASGLIGTGVRLAVIPGGTANVLSHTLGIGEDVETAARIAAGMSGSDRIVDAIELGGSSHVLLQAGVGMHAPALEHVSRAQKRRWGYAAYIFGLLQWLQNPSLIQLKLRLDSETVECEGVACLICNAGTMGQPAMEIDPRISMCDGLLDVLVLRRLTLRTAAEVLWNLAAGRKHGPSVSHWHAREVRIATEDPRTVQGDGNSLTETPVTARVVPAAVRVLVPDETSATACRPVDPT